MAGSFLPRVSFGRLSLALLLCLIFVGSIEASIIAPSGSGLPDNFTGQTGLVLLATTGPQAFVSTNGLVVGTLVAGVFRDPNNIFGANDLSFLYQVTNSSGSIDPVGRETDINFTGWMTDVGDRSDGAILGGPWVNGTVAPQTVDRSLTGDTVGFTFSAPVLLPVLPGQTSWVLEIQTNATNFTQGKANIIDGGVTTVNAFQPSAGVPEPTTMLMLGGGLIALAGFRRFRK